MSSWALPVGNDYANRFPMPAGGLFSTAADVTHFCQMLPNNGTFGGKRIVFLVQHAGFPKNGKEAASVFSTFACERIAHANK